MLLIAEEHVLLHNMEISNAMNLLKCFAHVAGQRYIRAIMDREYSHSPERINERSIEYKFVFSALTMFQPSSVLDVGTGTTALPALIRTCGFNVTAIDNVRDYWPKGMYNRHYPVLDQDIRNPKIDQTFDLVTCISVLEHIQQSAAAVRGMASLLNPGGVLLLTCPYSENLYHPNVYELESSYGYGNKDFITQQYSRRELTLWLSETGLHLLKQEYWELFDSDYWSVGPRIGPNKSGAKERHQLTCVALMKG
jgi:SAM-dependent methyltransferase